MQSTPDAIRHDADRLPTRRMPPGGYSIPFLAAPLQASTRRPDGGPGPRREVHSLHFINLCEAAAAPNNPERETIF